MLIVVRQMVGNARQVWRYAPEDALGGCEEREKILSKRTFEISNRKFTEVAWFKSHESN